MYILIGLNQIIKLHPLDLPFLSFTLLYKVHSNSTGKNFVTNVYCFYLYNLKQNTWSIWKPEIEVIYYSEYGFHDYYRNISCNLNM